MEKKRRIFLGIGIFLIGFLLFCRTSSANSTIIFQSTSTTGWNYFKTLLNLCGNGGWSKVSPNVSIKVTVQDANPYGANGKSYIEISVDKIKNILFSDGLLGFSLPEELEIRYENIKIIFSEPNGNVWDATDSYNACANSFTSLLVDTVLGKIPSYGIGAAYTAVMGLTRSIQECSDGNRPFYGTVFLDKNGWDQSLLPYEEPFVDDYSGKGVKLIIPITNKTRSEVLSLFCSKPMAIHGNLKCNAIDNVNCTDKGSIIFTKQFSYCP